MRTEFVCPACRATISAPASLEGEACACPKCNAPVDCWPAPIKPPVPTARPVPHSVRNRRRDREDDADEVDELDDESVFDKHKWLAPLLGWLTVWLFVSLIAIVYLWRDIGREAIIRGPLGVGMALLVLAAFLHSGAKCPGCERRGAGSSWERPRVGGGPDRRHKRNARRCNNCGYVFETYSR